MAGKKRKHAPLHPGVVRPDNFVDKAELAVRETMRVTIDGFDRPAPSLRETKVPVKEAKEESSIPHGDFKGQTEGLMPRSRMADTREMSLRSKEEEIEYYKQNIMKTQGDRLSVPKHMVPEGFSFMWARATVMDRPDAANLRTLRSKGWRFAMADEMPGVAFYDHYHGVRDDAEHIYNSGLVGVLRYKELNDYELKQRAIKSRNQSKPLTDKHRSVMEDLHPFANNSRINYNSLRDNEIDMVARMPNGQDFRMAGY